MAGHFGDSEESARVPVTDVVPGVIVSGYHFTGDVPTVILQRVKQQGGKVWMTGLHVESGRLLEAVLPFSHRVDTWGTL